MLADLALEALGEARGDRRGKVGVAQLHPHAPRRRVHLPKVTLCSLSPNVNMSTFPTYLRLKSCDYLLLKSRAGRWRRLKLISQNDLIK